MKQSSIGRAGRRCNFLYKDPNVGRLRVLLRPACKVPKTIVDIRRPLCWEKGYDFWQTEGGGKSFLERQVAYNDRPPHPKVAHIGENIGRYHALLAFQVHQPCMNISPKAQNCQRPYIIGSLGQEPLKDESL